MPEVLAPFNLSAQWMPGFPPGPSIPQTYHPLLLIVDDDLQMQAMLQAMFDEDYPILVAAPKRIPFSKTYPSMDTPCLAFGSCFTAASFTRGLRFAPALAAPQAF